jgi:hypothetical protein
VYGIWIREVRKRRLCKRLPPNSGKCPTLSRGTAAHVTDSIAGPVLAAFNHMITDRAAFVGIIDQFEVMMLAMLIASPLVLFLPKPGPAN